MRQQTTGSAQSENSYPKQSYYRGNVTKVLSDNDDIDMAQVIAIFINEESQRTLCAETEVKKITYISVVKVKEVLF